MHFCLGESSHLLRQDYCAGLHKGCVATASSAAGRIYTMGLLHAVQVQGLNKKHCKPLPVVVCG